MSCRRTGPEGLPVRGEFQHHAAASVWCNLHSAAAKDKKRRFQEELQFRVVGVFASSPSRPCIPRSNLSVSRVSIPNKSARMSEGLLRQQCTSQQQRDHQADRRSLHNRSHVCLPPTCKIGGIARMIAWEPMKGGKLPMKGSVPTTTRIRFGYMIREESASSILRHQRSF
jgi:hypothetical protein